MDKIADRIAARLKILGKNPSAVALEAGLGRSSVRDILVGKVASPRVETLQRLTGPLDCSLEYLTGSSSVGGQPPPRAESDHFDPVEVDHIERIEIGVFRNPEARTQLQDASLGRPRKHLLYNDLRLPDHSFSLFELGDNSLSDLNLLAGDVLTVATPHDEGIVALKPGTIVLVRRIIKQPALEELSVRVVEIHEGNLVLATKSGGSTYEHIELNDSSEMSEQDTIAENYLPNTYLTPQGAIMIVGLVARATRSIPL